MSDEVPENAAFAGRKIRQLRLRHNMTQEELHQRLKKFDGTGCAYLSQVEKGKKNIPFRTVLNIAEVFKVSLADFQRSEFDAEMDFVVHDTEFMTLLGEIIGGLGKEKALEWLLRSAQNELVIHDELYRQARLYRQGRQTNPRRNNFRER